MTVPGWEMTKEQGEQLIEAAERNSGGGLEIQLGGDPIARAPGRREPGGNRLPRRGDRPPDRVRLAGRGRPAAGHRAGRPRHHLRRPDPAARQRRRRPRLDDRGLGADRDRGRDRLLAAGADPVPRRPSRRPRAAMTRSSRRSRPPGRSVIIAGSTVVIAVLGLFLTGLSYMYGVALAASLAVLVVMLASITLLPALLSYLGPRVDRLRIPFLGRARRAEGSEESLAVALEPCRAEAALDGGDRLDDPAAGARRAGARHAARLPRRRQRPAEHDDPQGLRPDLRGLRPGHQRPARDRGRNAGTERAGATSSRSSTAAARRRRRRLRPGSPLQRSRRRGPDHRHPDDLAPGRGDPRPGQAPAWGRRPGSARTGPASAPRSAA